MVAWGLFTVVYDEKRLVRVREALEFRSIAFEVIKVPAARVSSHTSGLLYISRPKLASKLKS